MSATAATATSGHGEADGESGSGRIFADWAPLLRQKGHTFLATTSCSTSWPHSPVHVALPTKMLHFTSSEELHAAAGTARRRLQRTTRHSSLALSQPPALRVQHAFAPVYTAASSLRPVGPTCAACWPRRYIAQPLACTARLTVESLDGGSSGYSGGAHDGNVNCGSGGGGRKR